MAIFIIKKHDRIEKSSDAAKRVSRSIYIDKGLIDNLLLKVSPDDTVFIDARDLTVDELERITRASQLLKARYNVEINTSFADYETAAKAAWADKLEASN